MSRKFAYETPTESLPTVIILTRNGTSGTLLTMNFIDGSMTYYGRKICYAMKQCIVDNIGEGRVRVLVNKLATDLSQPIEGSKTLLPRDILKLDMEVKLLVIQFLEDSILEIVGIPVKS